MTESLDKRQVIQTLRGTLRRMTGREYAIDYARLDISSLRELARAVHDLEHEQIAIAGRARLMPWRK